MRSTDSDRHRFTLTPQPTPGTIVRARGCELFTDGGRTILDAAGGAVVNNIGHGRPEIAEAVAEAMRSVNYVLPPWPTPNRIVLADHLVEQWLPEGFGQVGFAGGGSEANDTAMRLARMYHLARGDEQRHRVIGRVPSYHGSTLATLSIGGHMARRDGFDPMLTEHPKVPWNSADAVAAAIESAGPETVAAFIAEPVIGASGPGLVAPLDYWAEVSEICREHGVLMISDEVMTGFGRTGVPWGCFNDDWQPDIIVAAKGLTGGYAPLSMVAAHDRVVEPLAESGRAVMFFTYSAHDSSCAAALAVLQILEAEGLMERAAVQGARLRTALEDALLPLPQVNEVRGRGLLLGVELEGVVSADVTAAALDRDVWIYPGGSGPAVNDGLLFAPPMVVTDDQIDRIASTAAEAIQAVAS
ncbi:MAG: aminotransferase class III-fold pyridoxal phosphate-dependent enzyme [Actinomycetota bacterium]